ncbi:MAG: endonuclease/exonuclease/phosphatase family protein [Anaerolineae bacterium]|nr:endonuclease/exonuclease/phosphatase family protein [Anaerolineae bacterium]
MLRRLQLSHLYVLEAGLIGIFFVQSLRLLIGLAYSQVASGELVSVLDPAALNPALPGIVQPTEVSSAISFLMYMLALPLLTLLLGRVRWLIVLAVVLAAGGRALLATESIGSIYAAALVVGGSLLYIALMIRHRAQILPYLFVLGFGADQLFRAAGNTLDPSWSPAYGTIQAVLSIAAIALSLITVYRGRPGESEIAPDHGSLPFWGGLGLAGLLFLEITLLALPNAVAGRAGVDYTTFVPLIAAATLLPLVPTIRSQMRAFISAFDGSVRGWLWMLMIVLLMVFGVRFRGIIAGAALVAAQFTVSLLWWWLVRPRTERERSFTGLWLVVSIFVFALLLAGDIFTYEYAFVRNLATPFEPLNTLVPSLLRGFRGMGLALLLLGVFLAALPMTQTHRRIPWVGGPAWQSVLGLLLVILASVGTAAAGRPPLIAGVRDVGVIRLGTYNLHAGFNEFFHYDLEELARTIELSGADVVLLQEVEAGRTTSYGVDQALWLARRLGMDRRFYPTNEGLQGLAVLSRVEIVFDEGTLLTSTGNQTGLQRVQVRPDAGVVTLYNTWLGLLLASPTAPTIEEQEQDQQQQLNEIFNILTADHPNGNFGRLIVGGTFNNTPTSPLIQKMRDAGFRDPFAGQPPVRSITLDRANLQARVDYLWLRPPLQEISAGVMDNRGSDHRMAVIELQIASR